MRCRAVSGGLVGGREVACDWYYHNTPISTHHGHPRHNDKLGHKRYRRVKIRMYVVEIVYKPVQMIFLVVWSESVINNLTIHIMAK